MCDLLEITRLQSKIIDRLYLLLTQHIQADELDTELLEDISHAASISEDYT